MRTESESGFSTVRSLLGICLCCGGLLLTLLSFAATPPSGTITSSTTPALQWIGTAVGSGAANGEASCVEGTNCDTFTLTVDPLSNWAGKRIQVRIIPPSSTDDFDLVIHKTSNAGPVIATSGNGPGVTETGYISPTTDGTGVFTVHVIYFVTVPTPQIPVPAIDHQYRGEASVVSLNPVAPPNAVVDNINTIGYENFEAPGVLTPVTLTTGPTVEYLGRSAGEPSIGVNWNSLGSANGVTNFQSDLETLFITFSDTPANGGGATASWVNRPAPTQVVIDSDPIGFTDFQTGRAFAAELSATSPTCKISYTDNDGQPWVATPGPLGSGIDHETIGGGPYALPLPTPAPSPAPVPGAVYPNAVYYCSQDLVAAFCLRSDDGGATWGPPVQTYTTECGGLHGHVKVSPADGSVYLPNKDCAGNEAAVVSENNGVTFNIRPVANATVQPASSASDPAVAIDRSGRVYFAMASADSAAVIGYSNNRGATWNNIINVSAAFGLQNVRYPAAIAGDGGRAAIAFMGSTTPGDANASTYNGVWHMYIAHTFDGGLTWSTTDATPNLPVQRGNIWTGGGANIGRNMLDFFDMAIDKLGRVQVGYVDGCSGGNCEQAAASAVGNAYSATAAILRQSSGKRMLQAQDVVSSGATAPGVPFLTQRRVGNVVHLSWSEADRGSAALTGYQVYRGTAPGNEIPLATLSPSVNRFDDYGAANPASTYYYKVVASNSVGSSAGNNEVAAPYLGDTCSGIVIHQNDPSHPESVAVQNGLNPQYAIDYVAVGEPANPANSFLFTIKVTNLNTVPPNSRWRMVWDSFASPGQQFYVGMTTGASGAPTFEYGTLATAVVGLVVGVPQETKVGTADPASNYQPDGTIKIYVPKAAVGNPQPGDLLGAVNGRTFPDNTVNERSTELVDHTFVKSQTDNAFPTATYTVAGSGFCTVQPTLAVSRKTHGGAGMFDVPLPLTGAFGIEDRNGSVASEHQVVITFPSAPVTVTSVGVTPGQGSTANVASSSISGNQVTVNLSNVSNAQVLTVNLFGVAASGGVGDVSVPMGILFGDVNATGRTDSGDVTLARQLSVNVPTSENFRADVNVSGRIDAGDVTAIRQATVTALPSASSEDAVREREVAKPPQSQGR